MADKTTGKGPKCGSARYDRQPAGFACFDCEYRELDDQTSPGWARVAIGTCTCGVDFGTRACEIGVVSTYESTCTVCGSRRSSTVQWFRGRADPIVISEDRPAPSPT